MQDKMVSFRITDDEYGMLRDCCKMYGYNASVLIRACIHVLYDEQYEYSNMINQRANDLFYEKLENSK